MGGETGLVVSITIPAFLGAIVYNWISSLFCDPCYNHSLSQIIPLSEVHLFEKQIKSTKQNCKPSQDPTQAAVNYYTALHAINLLLWNFPLPIVYVILGHAPFEDKEMAKSF
jgi:hypothetical protein